MSLALPRKLPRAKPCSDPNRIREPGEVDFDIEVRWLDTHQLNRP